MRGSAPALAAALAVAAACGSPPPGAVTRCEATSLLPQPVKTDVLFVIDDSGSMAEEQANLAANLDAFIDRLAASPARTDFQIGVTSTSVVPFPGGAAQYGGGPSAGVPYPAGALVALDPGTGRIVWDAAGGFGGQRILGGALTRDQLIAAFRANVRLGTNGSGKEQGLEAVRRALSEPLLSGANAGFLRPGARLAVVILSDEDDCTETNQPPLATSNTQCRDPDFKATRLEPVTAFADFLRAPLGGERREIAAAGIVALNAATLARGTSCATAADPAPRYFDFVTSFGANALLDSICRPYVAGDPAQPGFRATLDRIARLVAPDFVELAEAPADPRLLTVTVTHRGGATDACTVGTAATDPVRYTPPGDGRRARLTFGGTCPLAEGDAVHVRLLCAG
jgi:hypothetical protein